MSEPRPMPVDRPPLNVRDVSERSRYEATLGADPKLAGLIAYELGDEAITLIRTEVQEGFEGQGIGSRLVRGVLDDVHARGLKVIPMCTFVQRWLEKHPEQAEGVIEPPDERAPADPEPA